MKLWQTVRDDVKNDYTWNRVGRLLVKGTHALPEASAHYVVEKVPIVEWLPRYNYRWLINDLIAGLTLGLMLIPQALSYAKIATIPVEYGLMSSWLPGSLYAFMGTAKDLSTGPTSLIGLLTAEIVRDLKNEHTPSQIASAVAMSMGVYGMVLGFLKLGFLLEFISLPILSGFISAVAITIGLNQMSSLLGETGVRSASTAQQIHDIFHQLPTANGYACGIGFGGIVLMTILDKSGKRWGQKNKVVWFLSVTRAFICLLLFTGISYGVNKHRGNPKNFLFDVAQVKANGIEHPRMPDSSLFSKVFGRSIAVFIGATVEHTAIARGFAVKNNYVTDQSQELCYFGIVNFVNSFFHSMGVGGAMSRTAVNSACNVKSPLSGIVTTAVVLVSIFKLVGTLYWIPKATLAAIIITAVWPLISPPSVFYRYWKSSLADFISSMLAFWISLFVSTEIGIGVSVGFNIVYIVLRQVFSRATPIGSHDSRSQLALNFDALAASDVPTSIPSDTHVFQLNDSLFFPNSFAVKTGIMDTIQTHHAPAYSSFYGAEADRTWSVVGEKRVARLRRKAQINDPNTLPPIRVVVLDLTKVNHIDTTAVSHLKNFVNELKKYGGDGVQLRFVGMAEYVRRRFERCGWLIIDADGPSGESADKTATKLYHNVRSAVEARHGSSDSTGSMEELMIEEKGAAEGEEKPKFAHKEQV